MAPLRSLLVVAALSAGVPAHAETVSDWRPYVAEASQRFGIPADWIERVMQAESAGRTLLGGRPIRSRAGAIGLMQLMPATWETMRRTLALGSNPDDPRDNILAGTFYLRLLYARFGYPGLFAAYNAGPGRYAIHLATGHALPRETIAYLRQVGAPATVPAAQAGTTPDPLFPIRHPLFSEPLGAAVPSPLLSLFAVKHDGP